MILFSSIIILAVFVYRVASRTAALERAVAELVARVAAMEHGREPIVHPPIQEPIRESSRTRVRESAPDTIREPIRKPARELPRPFVPRATATPPADVAEPHRPRPAPSVRTRPEVESSPGSPVSAAGAESLETRIGSRWLLYIGVVAIVVGVCYFEKLAIDSHWIGETARVVQGGVVGVLFVLGGLHLVRKGFPLYGQMICGGGIAVLYVSTYAAFNFYHLIGRPPAMALMCVVTAAGAWLADRQRSQGLAVLAVGGGFATPFLLPTGTDAQLALFGYETVLIAGTMYLAHRRAWPTLNVASYGLTVLTVGWWAGDFYTYPKYLPTELFLTMFCAMYLYILHESQGSRQPLAQVSRAVLWTGPPLYYLASLAILADHAVPMLLYLLALTLTGAMAGLRIRSDAGRASAVRLLFWVAAAVPLLYWIGVHPARVWLTAGLAAVAGVYIIHLVAHLEATAGATTDDDRPLNHADLALLHLNGLGAFGGAYLMISAVHHGWSAPVAAAFALWHGAIAFALANRQREHALHFAALAFSLMMIAIGLQFEGAWITMGWAAEGAAVTALGLRSNRSWLRTGGLALFAIAVARLVSLQFAAPSSGQLVLLNERSGSGIFVIGLTYWLAWTHQRHGRPESRREEVGIALVLAKLLLLALAVSEISGYWAIHGPAPFEPGAEIVDPLLLIGSVIVWLGLIRRQAWMRATGVAVVAGGLYALLDAQLTSAPEGYIVLWNARAAAGLAAIATLYILATIHRKYGAHLEALQLTIAVLLAGASLFTLSLISSEIDAFWAARGAAEVWSMAREGLKSIAWASVGTVLIWLGLARRQTWLRGLGAGVLVAAIGRLLWLDLADAAPTYVVVANARLVASLIVITLLYALAGLYRQGGSVDAAFRPRTVLLFAANALTLTFLTSEITAYWHVLDAVGASSRAAAGDSHFAREMMLSMTWAGYATALVIAGIRKRYAPIRYLAFAIFGVTIVKVFAIDLAELDRVYRVSSIVGLGVMLLVTSYLYHRFQGRLAAVQDAA